jgi:hypothetical protein
VPEPAPQPEARPEATTVPRSARDTAPRRRATPPPRRSEPRPARTRAGFGAGLAKLGRALWLVLLLAAVAGLVADRVAQPGHRIGEASAGLMMVLFAVGLAARTGARVFLPALLAAALAAAAILTRADPLTAGAAVATGVLGSVLAVMVTKPAATFALAAREVVVALLVASAAALGVAGYDVKVGLDRFGYVVLGLSLLLAIAVVYQLGAGLHGLGRRGYVVAGTAVVVLAFALAYSRALAHWGSPSFIDSVDQFRLDVRSHLHAVPHPIEVLLGIPAIVWGVFMRARRRQGWWVCAFGVTATASAATHLIDPGVSLQTTLLSAGYSLVLGLLLGYVVIRVEQLFTGTHGRRARRDEEAHAHRPEPGRLQPLH